MANGELARIWKVTRFCCTSGMCFECKQRGNMYGDKNKRARIVHADNLTKPLAQRMAEGWVNYDAKVEAM
jgi:hypothetical protein